MKPATLEAAKLLSPKAAQAGPVNWLLFYDMIAASIRIIMNGCAPTPVEGVRYVAWKAPILKFRTRRHREAIEAKMESQWGGDLPSFRAAMSDMWEAVDRGQLTPQFMAQLYDENREP